jgi:hypothetical protein
LEVAEALTDPADVSNSLGGSGGGKGISDCDDKALCKKAAGGGRKSAGGGALARRLGDRLSVSGNDDAGDDTSED